jgi:hypothetical protein
MVIVKLMGGLGNQMFEYAMGRALSLHHGTTLKMDTAFLLDRTSPREPGFVYRDFDLGIFNIVAAFATPDEVAVLNKKLFDNKKADLLLKKIIGKRPTYFKEPHFEFYPEIFSFGPDVYLEGYWQSEQYFKSYEDTIREDFTFKNPMGVLATELLATMQTQEAVCVNVRRGDFVTNAYHGAIGLEYYKAGEALIGDKVKQPHFYVFSDDVKWCEENLHFAFPTTYVSHDYAGEKFRDYLQLMTNCKHFVIPNSSFGWWAAWLSRHANKIVVAPKQWFGEGSANTKDLLPKDWITI